jgi:hypothetical protein
MSEGHPFKRTDHQRKSGGTIHPWAVKHLLGHEHRAMAVIALKQPPKALSD